ncbi:hypothetical protein L5515_017555 [Caenorhabditis briggsae]|uniref:F-box domain-containing protein n=1 Tax=Caenorhabditis briggsae TaxID=6238 RepID=A0AAE9JR17_CAEBR|nr:hypothetical protein L5515_017555 [Caenorhabditis briggsae]
MSSLSENPPPKGIPFLEFTWHLKKDILELCEPPELIKLSLVSKRCKKIVGSCQRFPLLIDITMDQEFKIFIFNPRKITSSFTWLLGNYVTVKRNPHFSFENVFPTRIESSLNKNTSHDETSEFQTHCSRRGSACLRSTLSHLSEIFPNFKVRIIDVNAKLWDSSVFGAMDMNKIMECVQKTRMLQIDAEFINREMIHLMEKVKCTRRLYCKAENTMGCILNGTLQCSDWIVAENFRWFDAEQFQDLHCQLMRLVKTRITTRNVEDLIIKWRNSEDQLGKGVKNIKFIDVQIHGGVQNFGFSRVGAQPKGSVERPNEFTEFNCDYDFTNAFDIIHPDGTLASLKVVEVLDRVMFVVWNR